MKDDLPNDDLDLKAAFRAVRDDYDGHNDEANLTLQRALFRNRTGERRRRLTRWVVVPIAAVLAASTAWAGMTGRLTPAVDSMLETFQSEREPPPRVSAAPSAVVSPSRESVASASTIETPEPPSEPPPVVEPAKEPTPSVVITPPPAPAPTVAALAPTTAPPPVVAPVPTSLREPIAAHDDTVKAAGVEPPSPKAPEVAPAASSADPHAALFAEAHRLHFTARDPARALVAWDRYLAAAPSGRFSPEARYNRALTLVRLGRHAEAKTELQPFAAGVYGSYRRDDAKALLDALARDAGAGP